MTTAADIRRRLSQNSQRITDVGIRISGIEGQLSDVEAARRELRRIVGFAEDENRAVNRLDCEDPNHWYGTGQGRCGESYGECLTHASKYSRDLRSLEGDLNAAQARFQLDLTNALNSRTALNNTRRQLQNQLRQLSN